MLDRALAAPRILDLLTRTEAHEFIHNSRSSLQGTGAHDTLDTNALSMREMRGTISRMAV